MADFGIEGTDYLLRQLTRNPLTEVLKAFVGFDEATILTFSPKLVEGFVLCLVKPVRSYRRVRKVDHRRLSTSNVFFDLLYRATDRAACWASNPRPKHGHKEVTIREKLLIEQVMSLLAFVIHVDVPEIADLAGAPGRAECALAGGLDRGTAGDRYQVVVHVDADAPTEEPDVPAGTSSLEGGSRPARQTSARCPGKGPATSTPSAPSARSQTVLDDDISIGPNTATPAWRGERLDVGWAVGVLWRPRSETAAT